MHATPTFRLSVVLTVLLSFFHLEAGVALAKSQDAARLAGWLKERGTRRPIADVTVHLKGTELVATTNSRGGFELSDVPPGSYELVIVAPRHERYATPVEIRSGERTKVTYYLTRKAQADLEVVVHGQRVKREVSRKTLEIDEAKVIPGGLGDAIKVVENMPGVGRLGGMAPGGGGGGFSAGSSGLSIRGSNLEDSRVLLDGHEIPLLFHFGGFKSVYNSDLLRAIDLYTGGFGVQYGDATGGVVELKSRAPRLDRWGGFIDTAILDATALAEGPITRDMGVALAVRRSMLDIFVPLVMKNKSVISFTTLPVFYDYQAKWHYRVNRQHSVRLDVYGCYDAIEYVNDAVNDRDPEVSGTSGIGKMFSSAIAHHRFKRGRIESDLSPGYSYVVTDLKRGSYFINQRSHDLLLNEDLRIRLAGWNTLRVGAQLKASFYTIESNIARPPKEGDVGWSFSDQNRAPTTETLSDILGGVYLADEIRLGSLTFTPGLRFDYNQHLGAYAFSPSGLVRWKVAAPLVLKAAVGIYHRLPDKDEVIAPFGNTGLDFERAIHVTGGFEWAVFDGLELELQGYSKYMTNLVATNNDPSDERIYDNTGRGYAYGGEILLRHTWGKRLFSWASYAISRSFRNDGSGTALRLFDKDQTHNLTLVSSWELYRGWRLGLRFQYASGEPYTDMTSSILTADNGTYQPVYDKENKNNLRRGAYHQLDLRIDKTWTFDTWILSAYLDVQNVYFHSNPVSTLYNYDFSEKAFAETLPIIPSVGIKGQI